MTVTVKAGPTYCIDSTEVTNQQYAVFLAAAYPLNTADQWCSWNRTYTPQSEWPETGRESKPVVYVDWCDARAYCRWAGKHLCSASEWYTACSANGVQLYPYGNSYNPTACVGSEFDGMPGTQGNEARPAGTRTCEGAYPGLYDMSGNVDEWVDSCTNTDAGNIANCLIRGGSFFASTTQLSCSQATGWNNDLRGLGVGFRCCADYQH